MISSEHEYYRVTPLIVPADANSVITITGVYEHSRFEEGVEYQISCYPKELWNESCHRKDLSVLARDGALVVPHYFAGEQEHVFRVTRPGEDGQEPIGLFCVYSLEPDLFSRHPYKGDIHMHSHCSDGVESPAYVAACCRRVGLDFMALTDHYRYAPSLEAREAFVDVPIDMAMYPGEEVHPPGCYTHIINFGGSLSVNALFQQKGYEQEINTLTAQLGPLPTDIEAQQYVPLVWTFRKIHAAGGLGVLCHPHWVTDFRYNVPGAMLDYLFATQPFAAFEILGGVPVEDNNLQAAYYYEQRAEGKRIPIVSVSDSHSCNQRDIFGHFGDIYTLVFSPTVALAHLIESIKDLYSVAVEIMPGESPRVYGPFRLVKLALFLLREYIPAHDALCFAEGNHMLAYVRGDTAATGHLKACQGQVKQLMEVLWPR